MTHLLDTNVIVEMIRRNPEKVRTRLRQHEIGTIGVSSVTFAELQYGLAKSSHPERNRIALLKAMAPFVIAGFDSRAAIFYGSVRARLERQGQQIGPLDTMIAAHALALGAILVTANREEFGRVHGLKVENWLRD